MMSVEELRKNGFDIDKIMEIDDFSEYLEKLSEDEKIDRFKGREMYFLSDIDKRKGVTINYGGVDCLTTEIAYQAARCKYDMNREKFRHSTRSDVVKKMAKRMTHRDDWYDIKLDVMEGLLRQKFQNKKLREQLLGTQNRILIKCNDWYDIFWGGCKCKKRKGKVKQNNLGKLLMKLRDEIRKEEEMKVA